MKLRSEHSRKVAATPIEDVAFYSERVLAGGGEGPAGRIQLALVGRDPHQLFGPLLNTQSSTVLALEIWDSERTVRFHYTFKCDIFTPLVHLRGSFFFCLNFLMEGFPLLSLHPQRTSFI